jgi:hypothetical protein
MTREEAKQHLTQYCQTQIDAWLEEEFDERSWVYTMLVPIAVEQTFLEFVTNRPVDEHRTES